MPPKNDPLNFAKLQDEELKNRARQYQRYYELVQKQQAGDYLSPSEAEEFGTLHSGLIEFEKFYPEEAKNLSNLVIAKLSPTSDTNKDGVINQADIAALINSSFTQKSRTKTDQQIQQTQVEYVDLPTPEEFLDDFTNMLNVHITGLVQTGAINPRVAEFARQFQMELYGEYLRKQTENLLKGEPLWKVVGADAQNKLVGARTGAQSDTATESRSTQDFSRSESVEGGAAGPSVTEAGQAVEAGGTTSGTIQEDLTERTKFDQTNAIVARNKLSYVSTLAPLDFFKDAATAQRLNFLYAGQKGTATREAQTAVGPESAAARRI